MDTAEAVAFLSAYARKRNYTIQYDFEDSAAFRLDEPCGYEVIHCPSGERRAYVAIGKDGSLVLTREGALAHA